MIYKKHIIGLVWPFHGLPMPYLMRHAHAREGVGYALPMPLSMRAATATKYS